MDASLTALSPVDGRYRAATEALAQLLSESGLIRERVRVEALWVLAAGRYAAHHAGRTRLSPAVRRRLRALAADPGEAAPAAVKIIERRINHDVKAVEYFVRDELKAAGATPAQLELVHFGCTSEDINNLSYARLLQRARTDAAAARHRCAARGAGGIRAGNMPTLPMLSRTHGQTASPTTLGKEFANVAARLRARAPAAGRGRDPRQVEWRRGQLQRACRRPCPKSTGPTGLRALRQRAASCSGIRSPRRSSRTTGSASTAMRLPPSMSSCIDMCRDIWGYVSLGYLRQRPVEGEVGSSTMPHKVNPIDFENAEGNLGVANALLRHFSREAARVALAARPHRLHRAAQRRRGAGPLPDRVARRAARPGQDRARPGAPGRDLDGAWEVLAEPVQTVLRAAGVPDGYELLKDHSAAASRWTARSLAELIDIPATAGARTLAAAGPDARGVRGAGRAAWPPAPQAGTRRQA